VKYTDVGDGNYSLRNPLLTVLRTESAGETAEETAEEFAEGSAPESVAVVARPVKLVLKALNFSKPCEVVRQDID